MKEVMLQLKSKFFLSFLLALPIDNLAIAGRPATIQAMAMNLGANQYTSPKFGAKACFMVAGNITTSVNKGRWAGPMSGLFI